MTSPGSPPNDTPHASDDASHDDTSHEDASRTDYRRLRDDFDGLDLEHQATFLVDAVASLIAKGLETAGRTLAHEVDEFVERKRKTTAKTGRPGASASPDAGRGSSAHPDPSDKASDGTASRDTSPDDTSPSPRSAGESDAEDEDDAATRSPSE